MLLVQCGAKLQPTNALVTDCLTCATRWLTRTVPSSPFRSPTSLIGPLLVTACVLHVASSCLLALSSDHPIPPYPSPPCNRPSTSLTLTIYISIYIYVCMCVCCFSLSLTVPRRTLQSPLYRWPVPLYRTAPLRAISARECSV